jgi:hypothetical protein
MKWKTNKTVEKLQLTPWSNNIKVTMTTWHQSTLQLQENSFLWWKLNSFTYDPHELCYRYIIRNKKFSFIYVLYVRLGVFFNNISVISWLSVLFVEKQYPEKNISLSQVIDNFYHDDPTISTMKAPKQWWWSIPPISTKQAII